MTWPSAPSSTEEVMRPIEVVAPITCDSHITSIRVITAGQTTILRCCQVHTVSWKNRFREFIRPLTCGRRAQFSAPASVSCTTREPCQSELISSNSQCIIQHIVVEESDWSIKMISRVDHSWFDMLESVVWGLVDFLHSALIYAVMIYRNWQDMSWNWQVSGVYEIKPLLKIKRNNKWFLMNNVLYNKRIPD